MGFESRLNIVGNPSFSLEDKDLRRAGLDYWPLLDFRHLPDETTWKPPSRCFAVTKFSENSIFEMSFEPGDAFLFGQETTGLPRELRDSLPGFRLPMHEDIRSFNLANSVSMVLLEASRQIG